MLIVRPNGWGQGLFTTSPVQEGQILLALNGPIVKADDHPNFQVGANRWMGPSKTRSDALNHHCMANAWVDVTSPGCAVKALQDIPSDEEVTIDYSLTSTSPSDGVFECWCGSPWCRVRGGGGFHTIPIWQQERYLEARVIPSYVLDHYLEMFVARR